MYQGQIAKALGSLAYVRGSSGLAVALGGRIVTVDLFNKPATCEKVWPWLLSGLLIDERLQQRGACDSSPDTVTSLLSRFEQADWQAVPAVGEGEGFRCEFGGHIASVLRYRGALILGSIVAER
jgi:hypothetical protein